MLSDVEKEKNKNPKISTKIMSVFLDDNSRPYFHQLSSAGTYLLLVSGANSHFHGFENNCCLVNVAVLVYLHRSNITINIFCESLVNF